MLGVERLRGGRTGGRLDVKSRREGGYRDGWEGVRGEKGTRGWGGIGEKKDPWGGRVG